MKTIRDMLERLLADDIAFEIALRRRGRYESADCQRQLNEFHYGDIWGSTEPHIHHPPIHAVAMCVINSSPDQLPILVDAASKWGK